MVVVKKHHEVISNDFALFEYYNKLEITVSGSL
jgi:hypothetical protein